MPEIDYSEFEKFANELANQFPDYAKLSAIPALTEMADYLLGKLPEYPEETLGRLLNPDGGSWLRTDKQRKWFFAAVKAGEVRGWRWVEGGYYASVRHEDPRNTNQVGYPDIITRKKKGGHVEKVGGGRTGNLGRSFGREVTEQDDGVLAVLGADKNLAPYAPWVVGSDFPGDSIRGKQMYQAQIHVDRWWQFGGIMENNLNAGWKVFEERFWREFSAYVSRGAE